MQYGTVPVREAEGALLAHAVRGDGVALRKGHRLGRDDVAALEAAGTRTVVAATLEPGDIHEDEAAGRLGAALEREGLRAAAPATGRVNLFARADGLLLVDGAAVDGFNGLDDAITLATLPPFAVAAAGQMVATVKIIPFAAPEAAVAAAAGLARDRSPLRLAPFVPKRAALIQTTLPGLAAKVLDKTARITRERMAALGGALGEERRCPHDAAAVTAAITALPAGSWDLLLLVGASAITDRRDVLPAAVLAAGGSVEHLGMPVDPGNLLLLAALDGRPVLGLPGCARSPARNGFDWVLQRLAAGIAVTRADIQRMGVGGLLSELPSRPQPRESGRTPKAGKPRLAGLVLAAGQSRRMGGPNKLLMEVDGAPMVRRMAETALAAGLPEIVVVTGHQAEQVARALDGLPVRLVHNPDYALGLSTSLKAGIAALPPGIDGALVCLGDMPRLAPRHLRALIDAFDPARGRAVVVPTRGGKRGNPVLWARGFFAAMSELQGDVGARPLIGRHEGAVAEIELDDAVLLDIDTPEALRALRDGHASREENA